VHKDTVTCIIEKHIKDPALVKRLVDAWDSAVDLGVTTAKASPAQKKKKTDRAISHVCAASNERPAFSNRSHRLQVVCVLRPARLLFDHEKAVWPTGRLRTVLRIG
jgi:hypothetical protein